jgi:hypothetical protein
LNKQGKRRKIKEAGEREVKPALGLVRHHVKECSWDSD